VVISINAIRCHFTYFKGFVSVLYMPWVCVMMAERERESEAVCLHSAHIASPEDVGFSAE
jgi:hypothetical protein